MKTFSTSNGILIRLNANEDLLETLASVIKEQQIQGGVVSGLGTLKEITLGYYQLEEKQYDRRHFAKDMELLSLLGNITWLDGAPLVHAHVTISGKDYAVMGGHLFSAKVAATAEIFITPFSERLNRTHDEKTGLNLING